ncbi:MAG: DNA internalization-related competence protein ComEC/Rec2 [Mariprofundaceae bacterium]|nr:DNA internalization-related competence protein ComEC/Rec2 [Mariprofundaceae bacterium]
MAYSLGMAMWQTELIAIEQILYFSPLLLLAWFRAWRMPLFFFCVAMLWSVLFLFWNAYQLLIADEDLNHVVKIEAEIQAIRDVYPIRLTLKNSMIAQKKTLNGLLWVYQYRKGEVLKVGQRIRLSVKLHRPRNRQNPNGFDFLSYCFNQHISALGHAVSTVEVLTQPSSLLQSSRERIITRLSLLPDAQRGVLQALLLGDRQHIPLHIQEAFSASGAAHLLAISGLHMGMLSAWVILLSWWLLTRFEKVIVFVPVRGVCLLLALLACMAYATLAAWPLPAQRAVLMLAVFVGAWWFRQHQVGLHTLCVAWVLILWLDPSAIASLSLWLSFVAAAVLLVWAGHRKEGGGHVKDLLWVSALCFLATLPFIVHAFARFPVYSLWVNIMLVPLFSFWVLPLALLAELSVFLGFVELADFLFQYSGYGLVLANHILLWVYGLAAGNLWIAEKSKWLSVIYVVLLCVSMAWWIKGRARRALLLVMTTLSVYLIVLLLPSKVSAQLIVWDVGQGSAATLITKQGHVLQMDVSGRPTQRFNGGTTVASGLRSLGMTHLDVLALSHAQQDHIGGTLRLLDQVNDVGELWLADVALNREHPLMQRIIKQAYAKGARLRWLSQGDQVNLGTTTVQVLWPPKNWVDKNHNQLSLVLSIQTGMHSFLLAGDVEHEVEDRLVASGLSAHSVVLMSHHGSKSSNTEAWVKQLSPMWAIAQTGYKNKYHFPAAKVQQRYEKQGSHVLNTAKGAVLISIHEQALLFHQWHQPMAKKQQLALQWWHRDL